jgi:hypothetical protein
MAEPHITGVILRASVARRIGGADVLVRDGLLVDELLGEQSSTSATSWMIFSRAAAVAFAYSAGTSTSSHGLAVVAVEEVRLADDGVDDPLELGLGAHGHLDLDRVVAELLLEHVGDALVVGAGVVHLVDERDARHAVALHLLVDRDRLALHALARVEHQDRAVEHAQGALDLDGEVHVAWGVDDVDVVVLELVASRPTRSRSRRTGW